MLSTPISSFARAGLGPFGHSGLFRALFGAGVLGWGAKRMTEFQSSTSGRLFAILIQNVTVKTASDERGIYPNFDPERAVPAASAN